MSWQHFSPDYAEARRRFVAKASAVAAEQYSLPLDATGIEGEGLFIDIAWIGEPEAQRVLLHTSGIHGVEGFAGSAIQLALLEQPPEIASGTALVLVHVLNPWGMSWFRRVNAANVDLNRNFVFLEADTLPSSERYRQLNGFLNPSARKSTRIRDAFWPQALTLLYKHGMRSLKQSIAEGQYEFNRGLFYGGGEPQPESLVYRQWLEQRLGDRVAQAITLDVHSGLGKFAQETLIHQYGADLGIDSAIDERTAAGTVAYKSRGGLEKLYQRVFANANLQCFLQEFGTLHPIKVLQALRNENRAYHATAPENRDGKNSYLSSAFFPAKRAWRDKICAHGVARVHTLMTFLRN